MEYAPPVFEPPHRVLLLAASTAWWYCAAAADREQALDAFAQALRRFEADGATLHASFDDDLFATGQPSSLPYSIAVLYDVRDLAAVVRLVHHVRSGELGRMLRVEARVGRRLFLLAN